MDKLPDAADGGLALAFVGTIRHDGHGGIADDFATDDGVITWVAERWPDAPAGTPAQIERLRRLRIAARAAFAAAVAPHPPSRADNQRKITDDEAATILTAAVAKLRISTEVTIGSDQVGVSRLTSAEGRTLIEGTIALAVADFLTGPLAGRLRSCQAPRCVRYFVQDHGKQQWCKASCGNRARAARHAARLRARAA